MAFRRPSDPVLYRDFLPADLQPVLARLGVGRTVLVQATATLAETRFLLDLAQAAPFVAGVVGWWDGATPQLLDDLLAAPGSGRLVGVRPMLQGLDDVSWLARPEGLRTLHRLVDGGLVLDALIDPRHLATIHQVCTGLPDLRVVIDHMAKPWRAPGRIAEWRETMRRLGALPNCWVKLSGFPFAAPVAVPDLAFDRLVAELRRSFPPARVLWGSDWPVVCREGGYDRALEAIRAQFGPGEADAVLSGNAAALYGLDT